jgi:hypothetical protein
MDDDGWGWLIAIIVWELVSVGFVLLSVCLFVLLVALR